MILAKPEKFIKTERREEILSFLPQNAICAEIGVYSGKFTYQILENANPKRFYLIDPYWKLYGDKFWWNEKTTWKTFCSAVKIVQKHDKNKCATFVVDTDFAFFQDLADNVFDWVYVDSTHEYDDTLKELEMLKSKVKPEGFICGHDFKENPKDKHFGVAKAITEWLEKNTEYYLYLRDNHTQWIIKKK